MTVISGGSHPLDEQEIADHQGEVKRLKAQLKERQKDYSKTLKESAAEVERLTAELASASFERDLLAEALRELRPAAAAVDWHREYGVVLVRAMRERDEAHARNDRWQQDWNKLRKHRDEIDELNESMRAERAQLEQLCRDNAWLNRDQVLEVLNGEGQAEVTSEPCGSCEGSRWVDDENWQPEDWEWVRGRIPSSGRIPCGICNEGGWAIPDIKPGVEATAASAETATFISRPACGCSVDVASGHSTYCAEHSDSRYPWKCTCTRCASAEPVGLRGGDDDA